MSTAATGDEIRTYKLHDDGAASMASPEFRRDSSREPIVEYLTKLGIPLEDVKALSVEGFSLAYKAVHDN